MISLRAVCETVPGLTEAELRRWLAQDWVRPERHGGELAFRDVDVARIRLIVELHRELEVEEPTVPLVLSLLDQLYATRRQLRLVVNALDRAARAELVERLGRPGALPLDPAGDSSPDPIT
jgi:chaperone modulatory protein CbpM